eukprot:Lithocolla_globosa_v1_NODE_3441_length_1667_cov_81.475186.p2 type:complete len:187 gc:universal NODE_3441_length_1667_cov_81.475186:1353-793(-)
MTSPEWRETMVNDLPTDKIAQIIFNTIENISGASHLMGKPVILEHFGWMNNYIFYQMLCQSRLNNHGTLTTETKTHQSDSLPDGAVRAQGYKHGETHHMSKNESTELVLELFKHHITIGTRQSVIGLKSMVIMRATGRDVTRTWETSLVSVNGSKNLAVHPTKRQQGGEWSTVPTDGTITDSKGPR